MRFSPLNILLPVAAIGINALLTWLDCKPGVLGDNALLNGIIGWGVLLMVVVNIWALAKQRSGKYPVLSRIKRWVLYITLANLLNGLMYWIDSDPPYADMNHSIKESVTITCCLFLIVWASDIMIRKLRR